MNKAKSVTPKLRIAKLDEFQLDPQNANAHTQRGGEMLATSLKQRKFFRPVAAVGDNTIMAGNHMIEKAIGAGMNEAIVIETDGTRPIIHKRIDIKRYTSREARRLALEDNRIAEVSLKWDDKELERLGVEVEPQKTDDEHAAELMDKADELQKKWKVCNGDIWQIGDHLIICGDCTKSDDWKKLLKTAGVENVNGVFTSPPYDEQRKKQYGGIPTEKYVEWWYDVQANIQAHLADDGSFFVNIKPHCKDGERVLYVFDLVLSMQRKWKWKYIDELCWVRNSYPIGADDRFKNYFEPVYQFAISKTKIRFTNVSLGNYQGKNLKTKWNTGSGLNGGNFSSEVVRPSNVIEAHGIESGIAQSAQFPIALVEFFIKAYSDKGDIWLDPFLGSGTTICAAYRNNRRGFGIEKLEKYVAVCLERISDLTGLKPKRL